MVRYCIFKKTHAMNNERPIESVNRLLVQTIWPFVLIIIILLGATAVSLELMSSVRAYVGGESLWSKGQKGAYIALANYLTSHSDQDYREFLADIAAPLGDHEARLALNQASPDLETAYKGFIEGKNLPDDVPGMIRLYRYFGHTPLMEQPISIWSRADVDILKLSLLAKSVHRQIESGKLDEAKKSRYFQELNAINTDVTPLEEAFSSSIAVISRQIDHLINVILAAMTVLLVGLGLFFSRRLAVQRVNSSRALIKESDKNATFLHNASDGIHILNSSGTVHVASDSFCTMLGYSRDEIVGMNAAHWDVNFNRDNSSPIALELNNAHVQYETVHRRKDGALFDVEVSAVPIEIDGARFLYCSSRDISKRKQAENSLRESEERFRSLVTASSQIVWNANASGEVYQDMPDWRSYTGQKLEKFVGWGWLDAVHPDDRESTAAAWAKAVEGGSLYEAEYRIRRHDGEYRNFNARGVPVLNASGAIREWIGTCTDITDRKRTEDQIHHLAYHDQLTGLPNRQLFQDRLKQDLKRMERNNTALALLFIDLDRFKEVNDTLGHDKGDILLIETARRIRQHVRDTDTFARLGGDEFTIILPECGDELSIDRVVQNVLQEIEAPFDLGDESVGHISCSIGIAFYPHDAKTSEDLLKHADQAMYAAKDAGRNMFSYFTPLMQQRIQDKIELSNDLRQALSRGELEVYYQPIVELSSGRIVKAEALLRWNHPKRGLVGPADFIPLAEEFGIIHELGSWVFLQSISAAADWKRRLEREIQVSVNRSPVEFERQEFQWVEELEAAGLPGGAVTMEITEGLLLQESAMVQARLLECRNSGIEVSIDDFGTGYSALSYLKQFHIDYLKIDQSFVRNLTREESDKALVEAIIVMAHKLGIKAIAEGVETIEQRDLLHAFGCDYAQGYLYSKPVQACEFEKLLTAS